MPRRKAESHRIYGTRERVAWMQGLPCLACGYAGPTPRQVAHTKSGGMGRKADAATTVPLCPPCHGKQHQSGWKAIGMSRDEAQAAARWYETLWDTLTNA
jgi:hypothetical protein